MTFVDAQLVIKYLEAWDGCWFESNKVHKLKMENLSFIEKIVLIASIAIVTVVNLLILREKIKNGRNKRNFERKN